MNALLRAEARKVLTTRSSLVIAGFVILYPALSLLPAVLAAQEPAVDGGTILQVLRGGADVLTLAALLLGIVAVAGEYRHGTIVPTLLVSPRRGRFLAAKLSAQAALAVVLALAVCAVGLIAGTAYLATRDVSVDLLSSDVLLTASAATLVVTLYAVIRAAVGALVKNQTAAVAGALIWVFAVEEAIPLVLRTPASSAGCRAASPTGCSRSPTHWRARAAAGWPSSCSPAWPWCSPVPPSPPPGQSTSTDPSENTERSTAMEASVTIMFLLVVVAGTVFWIWALVDVIGRPSGTLRRGSQLLWALVIALTHTIGAAAYVFFGRPRGADIESVGR